MRVIILPDEGEWVPVPKKASIAQVLAVRSVYDTPERIYADMIAAAPPCRVVELPPYKTEPYLENEGWNACLDEIERRAKG